MLRLLAAHCDPESYVAGATPLNRNTTRYSDDIDLFHDREERVAVAALHDVSVLEAAGYRVTWLRQFNDPPKEPLLIKPSTLSRKDQSL